MAKKSTAAVSPPSDENAPLSEIVESVEETQPVTEVSIDPIVESVPVEVVVEQAAEVPVVQPEPVAPPPPPPEPPKEPEPPPPPPPFATFSYRPYAQVNSTFPSGTPVLLQFDAEGLFHCVDNQWYSAVCRATVDPDTAPGHISQVIQ